MLSAALKRGTSAPVLSNPSFMAGSGLSAGLSASATDLALEVYEDEIFDGSEPRCAQSGPQAGHRHGGVARGGAARCVWLRAATARPPSHTPRRRCCKAWGPARPRH